MAKKLFVFLLILSSFPLFAQNKKFDQLEMLYKQGHYGMVYRQSGRLLNTPDYDYSMIPSFYRSLAIMQLAQNPRKYKREKYNINNAAELLLKVKKSPDGKKIFEAHMYEIQSLKKDLLSWAEDERLTKNEQKYQAIIAVVNAIFSDISDIEETTLPKKEIKEKEVIANKDISSIRLALIDYSKTLIGTPYLYGGTTTSGFDCSGFTGYVLNSQNIALPRRSQDQYTSAKKLKINSIQPGDLVFFGNNSNSITHVGMIYMVEKDKVYMIHASTSQGVIITEITNSSYWTKRIQGYGTFIQK